MTPKEYEKRANKRFTNAMFARRKKTPGIYRIYDDRSYSYIAGMADGAKGVYHPWLDIDAYNAGYEDARGDLEWINH